MATFFKQHRVTTQSVYVRSPSSVETSNAAVVSSSNNEEDKHIYSIYFPCRDPTTQEIDGISRILE